MSDIKQQVDTWLQAAAVTALGEAGAVDPLVRPAKGDRFGDYQANLAMSLGKALASARPCKRHRAGATGGPGARPLRKGRGGGSWIHQSHVAPLNGRGCLE